MASNLEYYRQFEPIFGSWKIIKLLGEGSFGEVFEIEKEEFGAVYKSALKVITVPKSESDIKSAEADGMDEESIATYYRSFVEDFSRESSLMAKLKGHTNIVSFEDTQITEHKGHIGWDIFIRMELLKPLNAYIKEKGGVLSANESVKLGIDLCKALEICDKNSIIHRDIKPENIFISENGDFKLGDFGISRMAEKTQGASTKVGTRDYMAPEVFRGERYDKTVDVYSLSLVIYKLLNGNRLPFLPPAPQAITFSQRNEALEKRISGAKIDPPLGADETLAAVILKGCSPDPKERYQNAAQMRAALECCLSGASVTPVVITDTQPVSATADDTQSVPASVESTVDLGATIGNDWEEETIGSSQTVSVEQTAGIKEASATNKTAVSGGFADLLKDKKVIVIAAAAAVALIAIIIGVAVHNSRKKAAAISDFEAWEAEYDRLAAESEASKDYSDTSVEEPTTEEVSAPDPRYDNMNLIGASEILSSGYTPSFDVQRERTSNWTFTGNGFFNEYLYGDYKSGEYDGYEGLEAFVNGVDTIDLFTYGEYDQPDQISTYCSLPYELCAYYNGMDKLHNWSYAFNLMFKWDNAIKDKIDDGGEFTKQECLYGVYQSIIDSKGLNISVSQDDIASLYDAYKLDDWDLIEMRYAPVDDDTPCTSYSGFYKVSGNRLLVLLVNANNSDYGFIPVEYEIDYDENDNLMISHGGQTKTLQNEYRMNNVGGCVTGGEPYNGLIRFDGFHVDEGYIKVENTNGETAEATVINYDNHSITFSWTGADPDDWEYRHSIKEPFTYTVGYHICENTQNPFGEGIILDDGSTKYLFFSDSLSYLTAKLTDNVADDVDISSLSDTEIQRLTDVQQKIAEDMTKFMTTSGISTDDYTYNPETGKVTFSEGILFDTGSAELKQQAYDVINKFSSVYFALYALHGDDIEYLQVDGHADSTGSDAINQPLSENRAAAVVAAMNSDCPVVSKGYGSSQPVLNDDGTENLDASRRVEFRIILKVEE